MAMRVKPETGEVGLKQRYRVTNGSEYDRALVNRGHLTLWFDEASIRVQWTPPATGWPWQAGTVLGDRHSDVPDDQDPVPVAVPRHRWSPRYVKRSVDDGRKGEIAAIDPDC